MKKIFSSPLFLVLALTLLSIGAILTLRTLPALQTLHPQAAVADSFVTRSGTSFQLNGQPFTFVGFNLFDAANTYFPDQNKQGYSCPRDNGYFTNIYTEADLDQALAYMKQTAGASVLRFWAYQQYTNGGTDWSGIDKVIRVAKKNGMKLIPTLEDGPGYCTQPANQAKWAYNGDTWYTDGYKLKMGTYALTYPDYVRAIVTRYKDEPTIFSWMMMNEADTSRKTLPDGSTKIDGAGPSVLVNFAKDIGSIIKSIDANHLVTLGTQSNGASGASGKDFYDVYSVPQLDYTEVHDWGYWADPNHDWRLGEQNPLPGSSDGRTLPNPDSVECLKQYGAPVACSFANSIQKLNKPVVVGESGASTNRWPLAQRAQLLDAKMGAFFRMGGAGYLVWQWNKVVDTEGFDVLLANNDPLLPKMKTYVSSTLPTLTPLPTFTPTPIPYAGETSTQTIEGENMTVSSGSQSGIYPGTGTDSTLSGGKTLALWNNGTASSTFNGGAVKIAVIAISYNVAGAQMLVKVDGTTILDQVTTTSYTDYATQTLAIPSGTHTITVTFDNDVWNAGCSCTPDLGIDRILVTIPTTTTGSPTPVHKPGDINRDTVVNLLDYTVLFENYGRQPIPDPRADVNNDGSVNILDYVILFENFGR